MDFRRTLIVTDSMLTTLGMAGDIQNALQERDIFSVIYDGTQPNPTTENVAAGLKLLKEHGCDSVISLGGGCPTRLRERHRAGGGERRRHPRL